MARKTKAERLAVLKRLEEDYQRRVEGDSERARCARCQVPLEVNPAGWVAVALFAMRSISDQTAPLLCLNCRAYEYASKEKNDGK
jgi:hypothetical protein